MAHFIINVTMVPWALIFKVVLSKGVVTMNATLWICAYQFFLSNLCGLFTSPHAQARSPYTAFGEGVSVHCVPRPPSLEFLLHLNRRHVSFSFY